VSGLHTHVVQFKELILESARERYLPFAKLYCVVGMRELGITAFLE